MNNGRQEMLESLCDKLLACSQSLEKAGNFTTAGVFRGCHKSLQNKPLEFQKTPLKTLLSYNSRAFDYDQISYPQTEEINDIRDLVKKILKLLKVEHPNLFQE
ncbi:MAG: hypothetical protein MPJ24_11565 [Pirellulaceae bacterium]|nr:hypothetical protein [Pirellulaceae bacterium]